jgi:hypothetical protein
MRTQMQGQPRQKVCETPFQQKCWAFFPALRRLSRRIMVQVDQGKNRRDPISKISKPKKAGGCGRAPAKP